MNQVMLIILRITIQIEALLVLITQLEVVVDLGVVVVVAMEEAEAGMVQDQNLHVNCVLSMAMKPLIAGTALIKILSNLHHHPLLLHSKHILMVSRIFSTHKLLLLTFLRVHNKETSLSSKDHDLHPSQVLNESLCGYSSSYAA